MPSFTPGKKKVIPPVLVISDRFVGTFYAIWCFKDLKLDPIREIYVELKKRYAAEKKMDMAMIDTVCGKTFKGGLFMKKYVLEVNWAHPGVKDLDSRIVQSRFEHVSAEIIDELFQQFEIWLEADDGYAALIAAESAKDCFTVMDSYLIAAGLKKPKKTKKTEAEKRAARVEYAKKHPETARHTRRQKAPDPKS